MGRSLSKKIQKVTCIASVLLSFGGFSSKSKKLNTGDKIAITEGCLFPIGGGAIVVYFRKKNNQSGLELQLLRQLQKLNKYLENVKANIPNQKQQLTTDVKKAWEIVLEFIKQDKNRILCIVPQTKTNEIDSTIQKFENELKTLPQNIDQGKEEESILAVSQMIARCLRLPRV